VEAAPEIYVETALETAHAGAKFFAETVVDWVSAHASDHLDVIRAVTGPAIAAYEELVDWLEDMPRLGDFAIGGEHFAARLRTAHLLEESPDDLAARGGAHSAVDDRGARGDRAAPRPGAVVA
jgi:hypothetical protein